MAAEPLPFTAAEGGPILLDVSRLVSRIGLGPLTGIDRVEAAWLAHLQSRPHHLIARVPRRQLLLPPQAGADLLAWLADLAAVPPAAGLIARLRRARSPRARAEEALAARATAVGTPRGRGLHRAIGRALPHGGAWLAVGHANLDPGPWPALAGLRRAVLIHDTIPLDHPQFTRPEQIALFRRRLVAALTHADLVLTVSEAVRGDVLRWRDRLGLPHRASVHAAPIGTTLAVPTAPPPGIPLDRPLFVTLGTIEPRKNHALLLDAWQVLAGQLPAAQMPVLVIVGRRGWMNEAVFARLDALAPGAAVIECAGLDDGAVAALLGQARALLMPSRAEGFGLPLTEAAGRGIPVIAAPGPAAREVLGPDGALWLDPDAPLDWADAVRDLANAAPRRLKPLAIRPWSDHFSTVEALLQGAAKT